MKVVTPRNLSLETRWSSRTSTCLWILSKSESL